MRKLMHVKKSPKGEVQLEPSFSTEKVVFYNPINRPDLIENMIVVVEPVGEERFTGKRDKRGVPIFVQDVNVLGPYYSDAKFEYLGNNQWKIKYFSGEVFVEEAVKKGKMEPVVNKDSKKVRLISWAPETINKYGIEAEATFDEVLTNPPEWVPAKIIEEVKRIKEKEIKMSVVKVGDHDYRVVINGHICSDQFPYETDAWAMISRLLNGERVEPRCICGAIGGWSWYRVLSNDEKDYRYVRGHFVCPKDPDGLNPEKHDLDENCCAAVYEREVRKSES